MKINYPIKNFIITKINVFKREIRGIFMEKIIVMLFIAAVTAFICRISVWGAAGGIIDVTVYSAVMFFMSWTLCFNK